MKITIRCTDPAHPVNGEGTERVRNVLMADGNTPLHARLAQPDDEQMLLGWANDPDVRDNAFSKGLISPESHRLWFSQRLDAPERCRLFVVETLDRMPVGQVRFERTNNEWEIHLSLDSCFRRRGLGAPLVRAALEAGHKLGRMTRVYGRVKLSNRASRNVFEKLGFREERSEQQVIYRQEYS